MATSSSGSSRPRRRRHPAENLDESPRPLDGERASRRKAHERENETFDDIDDLAMDANGYTINQNCGTYRKGVARPIEDKASVARVYLELLAVAEADHTKVISVREVARIGKCSRRFAEKCMREIESGELVHPKRKIVARERSFNDGNLNPAPVASEEAATKNERAGDRADSPPPQSASV